MAAKVLMDNYLDELRGKKLYGEMIMKDVAKYPNPLEKEILETAEIKTWERFWQKGFTLAYGRLITIRSTEPRDPVTCCWTKDLMDLVPAASTGGTRVSFEGKEVALIKINPSEQEYFYNRTTGKRELQWATYLKNHMWTLLENTETLCDCARPETYRTVLRPELFADLESKFGLTGGQWYLLPTDCLTCT